MVNCVRSEVGGQVGAWVCVYPRIYLPTCPLTNPTTHLFPNLMASYKFVILRMVILAILQGIPKVPTGTVKDTWVPIEPKQTR